MGYLGFLLRQRRSLVRPPRVAQGIMQCGPSLLRQRITKLLRQKMTKMRRQKIKKLRRQKIKKLRRQRITKWQKPTHKIEKER